MPQLDIFTFLPQIIWFLVFYFGFYILFLRFILRRIFTSLRVRNKLLDSIYKKNLKFFTNYLSLRNRYILLLIDYFELSYKRNLEINQKIYIKFKLMNFLKIVKLIDLPFMINNLQSLYIKLELLRRLKKK